VRPTDPAFQVKRLGQWVAFYAIGIVTMGLFLFPIYWMILSSFKPALASSAFPPVFTFSPTLDNYIAVFAQNDFLRFLWNSLVIGVGSTVIGLVLGLPAAYAIVRFHHRRTAFLVLVARIAPGISYLVPWFILFSQLDLVGTFTALILAHLTVSLPLIIWIMLGFIEDVPIELEEAALIDGCSRAGVFWRVMLPLIKPGIATAAILSFIMSWNNFLYSVVLADNDTQTLPVAVYSFLSFGSFDWGGLTAAATLISLPVMLLVLVIQRHIVRGLAAGAVKG
jgi:multiple sugar transport system permease protein